MKFTFSKRAPHQRQAEEALRAGFASLGLDAEQIPGAACWGWRQGQPLHRAGADVLVLERGYIDRFKYMSLGWNGLNGRATFAPAPDDGGERFRACGFTIRPRRTGGEYVLVAGQVRTDMAVRHVNLTQWYIRTIAWAKRQYGLPVVFRPHPQEAGKWVGKNLPGARMDTRKLQESLDGAACVATFNSNTGVDAVLNGNAVTVADVGGMAHSIASDTCAAETEVGAREAWAHALAHKQWTLEEVARGEGLRGVLAAKGYEVP